MNGVDDERLMAYLDGELDAGDRGAVERALAEDAGLRKRLEAQRRLRERLAAHYGPVAEEAVPERFRRLLGGHVIDLAEARTRRARPSWQTLAALAATLVLGFFVGRMVAVEPGPVTLRDGMMVAQGEIARALDTQLASAQAPDAEVRIGVTFARADGSLCRTFESAALAGLACRAGPGWQMIATAAGDGSGQGAYRQAGASVLVLEAAQEMMAGAPLDAAAERSARDAGWR